MLLLQLGIPLVFSDFRRGCDRLLALVGQEVAFRYWGCYS
jgi:hypothetical protein